MLTFDQPMYLKSIEKCTDHKTSEEYRDVTFVFKKVDEEFATKKNEFQANL